MSLPNRLFILYAEDNEDDCFMLSTLLGFSDIDVLCAHTAAEAFQIAREKHFDLYLLESHFPDGSGFELCRQMRELKPQTPIIFYSGDAFETDKQKGLAAGADVYLTKPDFDIIIPIIFQLVGQVTETA